MKSLLYKTEETVKREKGPKYVVLGGGPIGSSIARELQADEYSVHLVDDSRKPADIPGQEGDPTDLLTLQEANLTEDSTVIVATDSDRRNLLVAQLVQANFTAHRIIVLTNHPERHDLIEEAGHESISAAKVISTAVAESV